MTKQEDAELELSWTMLLLLAIALQVPLLVFLIFFLDLMTVLLDFVVFSDFLFCFPLRGRSCTAAFSFSSSLCFGFFHVFVSNDLVPDYVLLT